MDRVLSAGRAYLQEGWVIANHILVSFHVAFISSVLSLPSASIFKGEVLRFIFVSPETLLSALFMYVSFHTGVALHEMGHFLAAARLNALNQSIIGEVRRQLEKPFPVRWLYYLRVFAGIPYGRAAGVKREGLNYYPDAPYNLAVAAAGPRMSRNVALLVLLPAAILIAIGIVRDAAAALYPGRLLLGIGVVALLDFLMADAGKYAEFRERERRAREKAQAVAGMSGWLARSLEMKRKMLESRLQEVTHPRLGPVTAPWQFRNCGMGGRHTEKEYPESNVSMQEAMFIPLTPRDYQDAQELTVRLQTRLKEIIESEEGCRVMGIGLEGGLAPYIEKGDYPLPEIRLWAMMRRAIEECGCRPGVEVAIALDPAMSELEIAYRNEFNMPDAVGMYLFWRDKAKTVMDRDGVLEIYRKAIEEYEIPILSIEDGFSENDDQGWKALLDRLGGHVFVIGDDLVTTNDRTIEADASKGLLNTVLIKANQIGTLYETLLAMLTALGKNLELVVSHRSKSPNDDMEAQIALACNALGMKTGGGANTERLVKYQAVTEELLRIAEADMGRGLREGDRAEIRKFRAYEEPTNAGIPTVGVSVEVLLPESNVGLVFRGATPLGTSAGTAEAVHLVDSHLEYSDHREVIDTHSALFRQVEQGVFAFKRDVDDARIRGLADDDLTGLFARVQRYEGKGCLTAVENVLQVLAPHFKGRDVAKMSLKEVDQELLELELQTAVHRGKIAASALEEERIAVMQRKQNLGMNGILSVSLALARGIAHIRGQRLYELLREEMETIIQHTAERYDVQVKGSRFSDYVLALREVTRRLDADGRPLYQTLREVTGLYTGAAGGKIGEPGSERLGGEARDAARAVDRAAPEPRMVNPRPPRGGGEPVASATEGGSGAPARAGDFAGDGDALLTPDEQAAIESCNQQLYRACHEADGDGALRDALRTYTIARATVARRAGYFELLNHRLFRDDGALLVPYLVGEKLLLHLVRDGTTETIPVPRFSPGTILTDDMIRNLARFQGDLVDLEGKIWVFDATETTQASISRIQDVADLVKRVNDCTNRVEPVHWLRTLVIRLSNLSVRAFVSSKNLQPEIHNLTLELMRYLNDPIPRRFLFLARVLVRNVSAIIGKPNLIDRLWNSTIELAEIHVRGSAIVNELRRSSHHALGKRTLQIAEAYLAYLETGGDGELLKLGFSAPVAADEDARMNEAARKLTRQVVEDLASLLGTSNIVARIREWREEYAVSLLRCEFGQTVTEEIEGLVRSGIREGNRWVYQHHLRILAQKVGEFSEPPGLFQELLKRLARIQRPTPGEPGFDAAATEKIAREIVADFTSAARSAHQDDLFRSLDVVLAQYEGLAFFETFTSICRLRSDVTELVRRGGFPEKRLRLFQLDCLLEEMGYLALRHVATEFDDQGVDIRRCFAVIRGCIGNLAHDGLFSRHLLDISSLLADPHRTAKELTNVLENLERMYNKIHQRATAPFEKMREILGLRPEELRTALANILRYMHDLNSMVHFSNIARRHILQEGTVGAETPPVPSREEVAAQIVHLSHRQAVVDLVRRDVNAAKVRDLYGAKGSGLLYISYLSIPTRDGFLLPVSVHRHRLLERDGSWMESQISSHLRVLEDDIARREGTRRSFGALTNPLLLAVRGGSVFSMPGMLGTVLFVGINDRIAEALARDDPWRAYDSYRRFLASFASVAWRIDLEEFHLVEQAKRHHGVDRKEALPWEAMKEVADASKTALREAGRGRELDALLEEPQRQLLAAIKAVLASWDTDSARRYREIKGLSHTWGTSITVQEMAFGNRSNEAIHPGMDETKASLTGVIPHTRVNEKGIRELVGDFKFSAVGDDLVSGVTGAHSFKPFDELGLYMPTLERRLRHITSQLRRYMGTDQETEFTVDRGILSILQARTAQTSMVEPRHMFIDPGDPVSQGLGVRGGTFRGLVAFDEVDCQKMRAVDLANRDDVDGILMLLDSPSPEDIPVILSADGLLTAKGGSTSHAAIAINGIEDRRMVAVMSARGLLVDAQRREAVIVAGDGQIAHRIRTGDVVSIHGTSGDVYVGSRRVAGPARSER